MPVNEKLLQQQMENVISTSNLAIKLASNLSSHASEVLEMNDLDEDSEAKLEYCVNHMSEVIATGNLVTRQVESMAVSAHAVMGLKGTTVQDKSIYTSGLRQACSLAEQAMQAVTHVVGEIEDAAQHLISVS